MASWYSDKVGVQVKLPDGGMRLYFAPTIERASEYRDLCEEGLLFMDGLRGCLEPRTMEIGGLERIE